MTDEIKQENVETQESTSKTVKAEGKTMPATKKKLMEFGMAAGIVITGVYSVMLSSQIESLQGTVSELVKENKDQHEWIVKSYKLAEEAKNGSLKIRVLNIGEVEASTNPEKAISQAFLRAETDAKEHGVVTFMPDAVVAYPGEKEG